LGEGGDCYLYPHPTLYHFNFSYLTQKIAIIDDKLAGLAVQFLKEYLYVNT
jgi:hypothetical protein